MEIWYVTDEQWDALWEALESPERSPQELSKLRELFAQPSIFKEV